MRRIIYTNDRSKDGHRQRYLQGCIFPSMFKIMEIELCPNSPKRYPMPIKCNLEEFRVYEGGKDYCLEALGYPSHQQRVVVKPHSFYKNWKTKEVNKHTIYIELGIAEYNNKDEQLSWKVLADYKPIELNVYYEFYFFGKNVIELR